MIRTALRLVAAVALTAATSLVVPVVLAPSASAAACAGTSGVTVVVDPRALGGSTRVSCVSGGGGRPASQLFPDAGEVLTYVQTQPGAVCRVAGAPANAGCVRMPPADEYWSLWWSNGTSGTWTYSSVGVGGLKVPAGGSVAFSWQEGDTRTPPRVAAPVAAAPAPAPSPTPKPKPKPTSSPEPAPTKAPTRAPAKPRSDGASSAPTDPATATVPPTVATPSADDSPESPEAGSAPSPDEQAATSEAPANAATPEQADPPAASETVEVEDETAATSTSDGGVPPWLVLGVIGALGLGMLVPAYLRRRAAG